MFGRLSNRILDWVAGSYDASTAALHRCAHACVCPHRARRHTRSTSNGFATKGREGEQSLVMRMKRGDKEEEAYLDEDGREHSGRFVLREESRERG